MTSPVVSNEIYVILGATGNTGSIVANFLLSKGKKVRVVGRDSGRLQPYVDKGAEAVTATVSDAIALTKAFRAMSKRAGSTVVEVKSSHAVYVSHPQVVAHLIEQAATGAVAATKGKP